MGLSEGIIILDHTKFSPFSVVNNVGIDGEWKKILVLKVKEVF